jgi:hypothetical protein
MFDVTENKDGTVNVMNVPVFKAHHDRRYVCDEAWLDRCVADFIHQKIESIEAADGNMKYAMLPSVTIGHTPENPDAPEPPRVAFVDNLRRVGKVLYADFIGIARHAWEQIKRGDFPYRSAEVIPSKHRLTNVSLLGGRYPHFSLPVMRFKQKGAEVVRYVYTEDCKDMDSMDPQTLAQQIAPLVAQILAEGQANATNNDMASSGMASAAGMDTDPTEEGDVEEGGTNEDEAPGKKPESYRHPYRSPRSTGRRVRYEMEHTSKGADHGEDTYKPPTDAESVAFDTEEQGMSKSTTKNSNPSPVSRYEQENAALRSQLNEVHGALAELQRHNVREAQAAKRMMLTAKCREIAALGYAIGDREQIDRHVSRMMPMRSEEVRDYVEDVLKRSPKVEMTARHGISDYVERPGRPLAENERYVAENGEQIQRLGLDRTLLDLSDVLS